MNNSNKAASKGKSGASPKGKKAALKDLTLASNRGSAAVKGGRKTAVKDSHDKYA